MFQDTFEFLESHLRESSGSVVSDLQKCKSLAKIIKMQRAAQWPPASSASLPSKYIADQLVECYVRSMEGIYRILHIPTFKRNYEALWQPHSTRDAAFIVQVKLVLAIGATLYDPEFSLRPSAMQWVYEAQSWLLEPEFKSRLSIQALQTYLLLLLSRELVGISASMTWISIGELYRLAIYMGLHRDPAYLPKRTIFAAEMHRRLWNTILEFSLQSSITSGGPPLMSLKHFDCEAPGNFDDEDLLNEGNAAKPDIEFTSMSIARELRRTLPLRLCMIKFLNDLGTNDSHEEALRLDAEFGAAYERLCHTLKTFKSSSRNSLSLFQILASEFIMMTYRSALHMPYILPSSPNLTSVYSRKIAVESSLKIWAATYSASSLVPQYSPGETPIARIDLDRLAASGGGFFRCAALQAGLTLVLELKSQLQESNSLIPAILRTDLIAVMEETKAWSLRSIEAGETNVKGYLATCVFTAHVEGLRRAANKENLIEMLRKAAQDAMLVCLPILEAKAGCIGLAGSIDSQDQGLEMVPNIADWDFMVRKKSIMDVSDG